MCIPRSMSMYTHVVSTLLSFPQTAKVMADERDDVTFYVNSQGRQFKFQGMSSLMDVVCSCVDSKPTWPL